MAISGTHYRLLKSIQPLLPHGGRLLEIGEANWYGDVEPDFPCSDKTNLHAVAKDCYASLFSPSIVHAIDMNGTRNALRHDLNLPLRRDAYHQPYDIVINHGTAEHIFNIAQVFLTMHEACCTYGLMIHESPFTGWVDHGFYCLQPTLFYDLAAANGYEVVLVAVEHIESGTIIRMDDRDHAIRLASAGTLPNNSLLYVVYRKLFDADFLLPVQGYYARTLSEAGHRAWMENRK